MLNIGFGEILLIGCLLLVVVGPERLPKMLRMAGRYYAKLRTAANELQSAFMDEADLMNAGLDLDHPTESPSGLPAHKPVRPASQLDEQRVPADPAAAIAAAQARRAEVLAEAQDAAQDVELEPDAGTGDEPVERNQTPRPAELASKPVGEEPAQG